MVIESSNMEITVVIPGQNISLSVYRTPLCAAENETSDYSISSLAGERDPFFR